MNENLDESISRIKTILICELFYNYCKEADALLDYDNLSGQAMIYYGTYFYKQKMIDKYGPSFMSHFQEIIDSMETKTMIKEFLNNYFKKYENLKSEDNL